MPDHRRVRVVVIAVGVVVLLVAAAGGLMLGASETGEVVVLRTRDAEGQVHETRLWIVDDAGLAWLRAGQPGSSWFVRLRAEPDVEVVRSDAVLPVRARPEPDARDRINALMAEKYGTADRIVGWFADRSTAVAIALEPR